MRSKSSGRRIRNKYLRGSAAMMLGASLAVIPSFAQQQGSYPPPGNYPPPQGSYSQPNDPPGAQPYAPPAYQQGPSQQGTYQSAPPNASYQAPPTLNIAPGTVVSVRVTEYLSSDQNRSGDSFSMVLDQPVIIDGWVVARRGQTAYGRVSVAQKAKAGRGDSRLGVELTELTLVDGQQIPVQTQFAEATGGGVDNVRNATTVGVTTGMGAIIGAAAGGGEGAGIGAAAGAAAGMLGVLLTPGRPTVIPPETRLNFRVTAPVSISTARSQFAFQPVSQQDYSAPAQNYDRYRGQPVYNAPQRIVTPPPPPYYGPYYYGPSYYYGPYYYSRPYWGFYSGPSLVFRFGDRDDHFRFDGRRFDGRRRR